MEEVEHKISVLEGAKQALQEKNAAYLRELSGRTIHSASIKQDSGSLISAVLVYALSKLVERRDYLKIKNWDKLANEINYDITCAIKNAMQNDEPKYNECLLNAKKTLEEFSPDFKHYIQEVIRKASINKASKLYEHGISLGQTANLFGVTNWELAEYTGQSKSTDVGQDGEINEKDRAKMALDFFGVDAK